MLSHSFREHRYVFQLLFKHCGSYVLVRVDARIEDLERQAPARESIRGGSCFLCKRMDETNCGRGAKSS